MAEGTTPLFTNWRTGQQLTIASGIGTASITNSQLEGPISSIIGTASVTNAQLAGPIVAIIGTSSVSNSQLTGPIVAIIGTSSVTNSQIDNAPVLIASGSLSGSSQINITDIPQGFTFLSLQFISTSYVTAAAGASVQISTDNGASYDSTAANYSLFSFSGLAAGSSIVVPFVLTTAGDTFDLSVGIVGYQVGMYPRADGHLKIAGVGSNMSWGLYVGSTASVSALRITLSTTSFDAGTYRLHGVY